MAVCLAHSRAFAVSTNRFEFFGLEPGLDTGMPGKASVGR